MSKRVRPGSALVAVSYIRASKEEQRLSPEAQRASIEAWATREGIHVAAWHVDHVCSVTAVEERPALVKALAALREHGAGILLVAKRDRVARDVVVAATVDRAVASSGARVVSAAGEGNGDAPADQFMRGVIDCAAQYERGLIRARTKAALAAKSAKGERIGAVPYGFALAVDGVHLETDADEQAVIRRARELRAQGWSLREVAASLAHDGHVSRTRRSFDAKQIARMVDTA